MTRNKERFISLDVLRIICCFMVIAIHILMSYRNINEAANMSILTLEAFCRCCVPIFLMLTGFFMFNRQKTVKEVIAYVAKRIILPTIILLLFIQVFSQWLYGKNTFVECILQIDVEDFKSIILMFTSWKMPYPNFWLWYITTLVQMYFLYPLLKYICVDKHEENIVRRGYLVICCLAKMVIPTMDKIIPGVASSLYVYTPFTHWAYVYLLLGYEFSLLYEKKSKILNIKWGLILYVLGNIITLALTKYIDIADNNLFDHLFWDMNILSIAISAIGLFIVFLKLPKNSLNFNKAISQISSTTFIIYLIHYPVTLKLNNMGLFGWFRNSYGVTGGCILFSISVFCIAYLIATILQNIKKIKILFK